MLTSKRWDQYWQEHPDRTRWLRPDPTVQGLIAQVQKGYPFVRRVLDLGCGLGRHTLFLAQRGFEVHGVDNSPQAITYCQRWLAQEGVPVSLLLADITALPYRNACFDLVLSYCVVHHGTLATMERTFREVYRVLAAGGLFYVNFWSSEAQDQMQGEEIEPGTFVYARGTEAGIPHHFTSPSELEHLVHGFEVLQKEQKRQWRLLMRKKGAGERRGIFT
ncbi:MAG: class I SAM-dependent methyltransferase [Nitrospinota bacterium]|nr:MAG: class I SAM-dependent methyltransferase [Nitrospinota bacterium]